MFQKHPTQLTCTMRILLLLPLFGALCQALPQFNSSGVNQERFYTNPILDHIAPDPNILKYNGFYYMVYTLQDRIEILKSPILSNFRNAERKEVFHVYNGRNCACWAPELHNIRGELFIYFTMDDCVADANHRMYVIKADSNDPMGIWSSPVRLPFCPAQFKNLLYRLLPEENIYAIDGTVLQYDNQLYFIWTGFPEPPGSMNLYIARMENPMRVLPPRILLRTPTMDWEMHGYPVNEGPFIVQNAGRTFLIFSASSTFTPDYCLGMMGIDDMRDPLIQSNWWNDLNFCLFQRNDAENVFGTGHASFVRSPDDSELWMVYHAVDDVNDLGINRRARIQKMDWNADNSPKFPAAIGINKPLPAPSGEQ
ncbi:Extracellular exo-alpha-(1-_5)-L-arabinofuranosidase [Orchesella cincta]|uniref:Extracellular exo-alpha-(1->5)-L-arabinofuranosidase n=1 Tax=Orchesella cincta TaxID=48709 RepID=A0A1D2MQM7_ORCCI|nr:Extracellular exo-alpha-(1->5)-L-arabinofuranosidase [Orchesella cincta]